MVNQKGKASLKEHLAELRTRLLRSVLGLLPAFIICWFLSDKILSFLRRPLKPFLKDTNGGLIFIAPLDNFVAHLQVAFVSALLFSSPYWLNQLWQFISPGLYKKEKKVFLVFWVFSIVLFLLGISFAYFVVFPLVFSVLMNFGGGIDKPFITIKNYLSFVTRFALVFGIVFEMPLLLIFLCRQGIISPKTLKKYRRQAIVVLSFLSALLTPPDVLSLFLLLFPLIVLYEGSIYLAFLFQKKKKGLAKENQ